MFPGRPSLLIRNAIKVVPNEAPLRSREERTYIAWLGVFRDQKNLPLLLHVAQALPGTEFRVGGMRLAGTSAATQAAVEELGRLQNVRMLGYLKRNQVPQFLGGATALLCTSHFEGFSNAFLEAFVVGTPVLTRKGVDPDMIVEANGLGLVAADDAELIVKVSELSAMRADTFGFLAGKCRGYVEENHTPRVAMQSLVHALDQLIRDRRKIS
jgi:glycosyltransferase involved in cell wall biosynthesis